MLYAGAIRLKIDPVKNKDLLPEQLFSFHRSRTEERENGDTYNEAIADVASAIRFHIETFSKDAFSDDEIIDTKLAEVAI